MVGMNKLKIAPGDSVLLKRVSILSEWNIPAHLNGQVAEVLALYDDETFGCRVLGDVGKLPISAIDKVCGHGLGKVACDE